MCKNAPVGRIEASVRYNQPKKPILVVMSKKCIMRAMPLKEGCVRLVSNSDHRTSTRFFACGSEGGWPRSKNPLKAPLSEICLSINMAIIRR